MREELTREKREGCGASRIVESGKPTAKGVRARGAEVACGSFDGSIVASPHSDFQSQSTGFGGGMGTAHAWVLVANKGPSQASRV
jgi:energy-converting hydrogenase Eha subunit B